jgi:hypothetical protein
MRGHVPVGIDTSDIATDHVHRLFRIRFQKSIFIYEINRESQAKTRELSRRRSNVALGKNIGTVSTAKRFTKISQKKTDQ